VMMMIRQQQANSRTMTLLPVLPMPPPRRVLLVVYVLIAATTTAAAATATTITTRGATCAFALSPRLRENNTRSRLRYRLGSQMPSLMAVAANDSDEGGGSTHPPPLVSKLSRRDLTAAFTAAAAIATTYHVEAASAAEPTTSSDNTEFVQRYEDFVQSGEGWSYRDVPNPTGGKVSGEPAKIGDRVVYDWSGYTIGVCVEAFQQEMLLRFSDKTTT